MAVLEFRASPCRPRRLALQRVMSRPSSATVPELGRSKPVSRFTRVDLPAPFGPINPTTSCRCSVQRDAADRRHAVERAREVGGPERSSGPPFRGRLLRPRRSRASRSDRRDDLGDDRADPLPLVALDRITRYRRPYTGCSCGEKLTRPTGSAPSRTSPSSPPAPAVRRPARALDRGDDAVDCRRAGHEPACARLERLRERVHGRHRVVTEDRRVGDEVVVRDLLLLRDPVRAVPGPRVEHGRLVPEFFADPLTSWSAPTPRQWPSTITPAFFPFSRVTAFVTFVEPSDS